MRTSTKLLKFFLSVSKSWEKTTENQCWRKQSRRGSTFFSRYQQKITATLFSFRVLKANSLFDYKKQKIRDGRKMEVLAECKN
jgi:hypothetical protein